MGLPQLNPSSFPSQIFWLIVTFCLLYIVLSRSILPKISAVLQTRQERIAGDLDKAERLNKEADDLEYACSMSIKKVHKKAHEIMSKSSEEADRESSEQHADLEKVLLEKSLEANEKIEKARAEAIVGIAEASEDVCSLIVKKIANISIDEERVADVVKYSFEKG